jgi:hypothetical protein
MIEIVEDVSNKKHIEEQEYAIFLAQFQHSFNEAVEGHTALYTTDATNLFQLYLDNLNPDIRQYHTCRTCEYFFTKYGNLVTISETGQVKPVMWALISTHSDLLPAIVACYNKVAKANVTGVFVNTNKMWGQSQNQAHNGDIWTHIHVTAPSRLCSVHGKHLTDNQVRANKAALFESIANYLYDIDLKSLKKARSILRSDQCYRAEPVIGGLEFLLDLKQAVDNEKNNKTKLNLIWRAIATNPEGYCHPRASMVGYVLESIAQDLHDEHIIAKFNEAMNPTKYRTPTAAPAEQLIDQAEKIVQAQGLERSFERRYAATSEIQKIWVPKSIPSNEKDGFFSKVRSRNGVDELLVSSTYTKMTWEKFRATVLDTADQIEVYVKPHNNPFGALVTNVHSDAKPIIQWDNEDQRNPFSWYVHVNGVSAANIKLAPGWTRVTAISLQPNLWNDQDKYQHLGKAVFLILEGIDDLLYRNKPEGAALFPQIMKSEYHSISRVIQAYSDKSCIQQIDMPKACGFRLSIDNKLRDWEAKLRVTSYGVRTEYHLDRWD